MDQLQAKIPFFFPHKRSDAQRKPTLEGGRGSSSLKDTAFPYDSLYQLTKGRRYSDVKAESPREK